jgi:hypothetical protein
MIESGAVQAIRDGELVPHYSSKVHLCEGTRAVLFEAPGRR